MMILRRCMSTKVSPSHFIKRPQFDFKTIIEKLPEYKYSIKHRKLISENTLIEKLELLPKEYNEVKKLKSEINEIQRARNLLELQIKTEKINLQALLPQIKQLKEQFQTISSSLSTLTDGINLTAASLPNLLSPKVPLNGVPDIDQWINKPEVEPQPNSDLSHVDIMKRKNMIDLQSASITTGTSSYYLLNEGAQLELALINYAMNMAIKHGFQFVLPPSLARLGIIDACGFRPRDMNGEKQIYAIEGQDVGLVATAEITLAALGYNNVIDLKGENVKKVVGLSRCYRAEAGARGKDTKGLYRVHEFSKVELFCWSKPEVSNETLESLKNLQIEIFKNLGIFAKVINNSSDDLGNPAYNKYDIEAWMPGRGSFGEISSTSNCTDFQSRRLNTKYRDDEGNLKFVHTVNGTAMAIPRVIVAIIENSYDPVTDTIKIPECLRPYMGGKEFI